MIIYCMKFSDIFFCNTVFSNLDFKNLFSKIIIQLVAVTLAVWCFFESHTVSFPPKDTERYRKKLFLHKKEHTQRKAISDTALLSLLRLFMLYEISCSLYVHSAAVFVFQSFSRLCLYPIIFKAYLPAVKSVTFYLLLSQNQIDIFIFTFVTYYKNIQKILHIRFEYTG